MALLPQLTKSLFTN